jgi:hypothetical protein
MLIDEIFDLNPLKGWLRDGALHKVKMLFASTTASRLIADPANLGLFQRQMRTYKFRDSVLTPGTSVDPIKDSEASKASATTGISQNEQEGGEEVKNHDGVNDSLTTRAPDSVIESKSTEPKEKEEGEKSALTLLKEPNVSTNVTTTDNLESPDPVMGISSITDESRNGLSTTPYIPPVPISTWNDNDVIIDPYNTSHSPRSLSMPTSTVKYKSRYVEMCHITTGEVLRIFPSQKEAALMLGVSQAGISQCCSGVKPDSYGFKWRFYDGPTIDCKSNYNTHTPLVIFSHEHLFILIYSCSNRASADTYGRDQKVTNYARETCNFKS